MSSRAAHLGMGLLAATGALACHPNPKANPPDAGPTKTPVVDAGPAAVHSSSLALSADGSRLYVVNADSDTVSVVDPVGRTLLSEILLAPSAPAVDADEFVDLVLRLEEDTSTRERPAQGDDNSSLTAISPIGSRT